MGGLWMRRALPGVLILSLVVGWSLPAWSQVEEIVVTVRKKGENLQDVPMSVTAMSAEEITRKGIKDITDIAQFSTSLQFDESFAQSDTRIAVRGLSPTRGRQNVALLVDGIDVSSESITSSGGSLLLNTRLVDIERIEVVLGPQMALYGRSAFNGAIQYITKDAADEFEANLNIDAGYSERFGAPRLEAIGGISGPILGDALGYRLNGTWWEDEGYYTNNITGKKIGGGSGVGVALTLNSAIGDNWSFKLRGEYTDDDSQPSAQVFLPFNSEQDVPAGAFAAGVAECNDIAINGPIDFISALGTIPGNNQAYLDRAMNLMDPSFFAEINAGLNPNYAPGSLDPNSPNFVIPGGGGPYCERRTPVRVGDAPSRDALLDMRGVTLAPNPATPGRDFQGFDREMFRLSFIATYEADNWSYKSLWGLTRDDNTEQQDTNAFAFLSPNAGAFLDGNVNSFAFNNAKVTEQVSIDNFVTTSLDGPVNGMLGLLYWSEKVDNRSRSITAQASGSHCLWGSVAGDLDPLSGAAGPDSCTGYTSTPVAPYQQAAVEARGQAESPADRDTEHASIYGSLEFEFADRWTLGLEGRYNRETVNVAGPIFYDPGASGGPGGLNPCGIFFRPCESFADWVDGGNWFADSFFPWTDEAPDGTPLNAWVPDQAALNAIPDLCSAQNSAGVQRSINEGPFLIEREADGTPVWQEVNGAGTVVPILDNGRAIPTQGGTDTFNPWCIDQLSDTDSWFSPKATLEWAATDDVLLYFSWSRARKPGGFSLLTVGSAGLDRELSEFDPELMAVWEVGGNSMWLDNTIVVNGSIFFQDFTDKQALTSALGNDGRLISRIVNAGSAEVWGTELSIAWNPMAEFLGGNWSTSLGGTWLPKRKYTDFVIDSTSPNTAAHAVLRPGDDCTPKGNLCSISYTGNKLENSAALALNGFAQYSIPLTASVNTFVETDVFWQSKRYTGITNRLTTEAYLEMNFRWGFQGGKWDAVLYVDNLLDNDTVRSTGGGPGLGCCFTLGSGIDIQGNPAEPASTVMVDLPLYNTAFLPNPRVIGMRMSYNFGGH